MTPAVELKRAEQIATKAALELVGQGLHEGSLSCLFDAIAEMSMAIKQLPTTIIDQGGSRCLDCEHYKEDRSNEPCGEGTAPRTEKYCGVPKVKQCPMVIDAGFAQPPIVIPDYLKRQAE